MASFRLRMWVNIIEGLYISDVWRLLNLWLNVINVDLLTMCYEIMSNVERFNPQVFFVVSISEYDLNGNFAFRKTLRSEDLKEFLENEEDVCLNRNFLRGLIPLDHPKTEYTYFMHPTNIEMYFLQACSRDIWHSFAPNSYVSTPLKTDYNPLRTDKNYMSISFLIVKGKELQYIFNYMEEGMSLPLYLIAEEPCTLQNVYLSSKNKVEPSLGNWALFKVLSTFKGETLKQILDQYKSILDRYKIIHSAIDLFQLTSKSPNYKNTLNEKKVQAIQEYFVL